MNFMADWTPDLSISDKPRYLAIADAIADDIGAGRLAAGDRLPPQRKLAKRLDVDFTTVARGYVEAQRRGLIESKVGQGTFVRDKPKPRRGQQMPPPPRPVRSIDEPAAGARRSGTDRTHAGRRRVCVARYRLAAALPGVRRHPGRQGRGLELARPPRAGAGAGTHFHLAGRASGAARHPHHSRQAGRCRSVRGHHLSRDPLDRGPARADADRPADGRGRHRGRCAGRGLQEDKTQGALSQPDAAEPDHADDQRPTAARHRRHRAPFQASDRRGRRLRIHPAAWPCAVCRDRARFDLACRRSRQMHRRRASRRLCRGSRHPLDLAVRGSASRRHRDGLAVYGRAGDALDRGRHRRHAAALHPQRDRRPAKTGFRDIAERHLPERSA